ncbi:MAG: hypothetical protein ACE5EG_05650 [Thermoanaerobaculia bacterium]
MRIGIATLILTTALLAGGTAAAAQRAGPGLQIAGALSAAPEDRREGATVLGYSPAGELVTLRAGTNELLCLADRPGDDRFHVACYHRSLEPYMRRGRELRAEGVESAESFRIRHEEADAGALEMPQAPAALYNLGGPLSILDPATGKVDGGHWVWVVYTPWATEEGTGLPTTPQAPGAPWIMRPGTASSHIMIVQPREPEPETKPDAKP